MDEGYIIVTIDGQDYYCQADRVNDIKYIDGKLVNISNSSITLVSTFGTSQTYPYISLPSMRQGVKYTGSSYNGIAVTSNIVYNKKTLAIYDSRDISITCMLLLLLILGVKLLWKR